MRTKIYKEMVAITWKNFKNFFNEFIIIVLVITVPASLIYGAYYIARFDWGPYVVLGIILLMGLIVIVDSIILRIKKLYQQAKENIEKEVNEI